MTLAAVVGHTSIPVERGAWSRRRRVDGYGGLGKHESAEKPTVLSSRATSQRSALGAGSEPRCSYRTGPRVWERGPLPAASKIRAEEPAHMARKSWLQAEGTTTG